MFYGNYTFIIYIYICFSLLFWEVLFCANLSLRRVVGTSPANELQKQILCRFIREKIKKKKKKPI